MVTTFDHCSLSCFYDHVEQPSVELLFLIIIFLVHVVLLVCSIQIIEYKM